METKRVIEDGKVHWANIPGEIIESIGKEVFGRTSIVPEVRKPQFQVAPLPAELIVLDLSETA